MNRRVTGRLLSLATVVILADESRVGAEQLGVTLHAPVASTLTQGGAPNFADTFVTPHVATTNGTVVSWKAQFLGGQLANGLPGVPAGIQLKVLRMVSPTEVQVVAAGSVHDPRPALQARLGAAYPFFSSAEAVLQFADNLAVSAGDIVGLTLEADSAAGAYFYPLGTSSDTRFVSSDVGVGGVIDLSDPFAPTLPGLAPIVEVQTVVEGRTLTVDGTDGVVDGALPCPAPRDSAVYRSIGKAIDCAQSGDVISVALGTYPEQLVVDAHLSGLTIRSEDGSARDDSPDVIISPPEPAAAGADPAAPGGGIVVRASFVTLMGLKIVDETSGHDDRHVLVSVQADNSSLLDNWIVGRGDESVASDSAGIETSASGSGVRIQGNLIEANGTGLLCAICGMLSNDGNAFIGNEIAIHIENSTVDGIRSVNGDLFVRNRIGLLCTTCGMMANDGNTFIENGVALHIENATVSGISIQRDLFVGNGIGFLCTVCGSSLQDDNIYSGNAVAIQIEGSTAAGIPTIHHDQITGNGIGLNNLTDFTIDAHQNYWGCPTGPGSPGCDTTVGPVDTAGSLAAGGIDIRPGGFPNPVNPTTKGRIPVAVLTTATFDASTLDVASVRFGATGTEAAALHSSFEDVDFDGDLDLVLRFDSIATGLGCGVRSAVLTGRTLTGTLVQGSDSVQPAGCEKTVFNYRS